MYILTIRFKDLRPQEIRFRRKPEIHVLNLPAFRLIENNPSGCIVYVNGKPFCTFCVPAEGWG